MTGNEYLERCLAALLKKAENIKTDIMAKVKYSFLVIKSELGYMKVCYSGLK